MAEEIANSKENNNSVELDTKTESEITEKEMEEFGNFVDQEIDLYEGITDRVSEDGVQKGTAAFVHALAHLELKRRVKTNKGVSAIFARDKGELVGYSIVSVDRDTNSASNTFLGVRGNYQRRGIATLLLQARHEELRSLGITSYQTNARESVLKLYDKLGTHYTIHFQLQGSTGFQVTVYLPTP